MIVVSLDPSSTCVGWGALRCDDEYRGTELVSYGKYRPMKENPEERIGQIGTWLEAFIPQFHTSRIVIEKAGVPYAGRRINPEHFNHDGQAGGQVYQTCRGMLGIEKVFGVYPQTWKKSVKKERHVHNCNLIYGTKFTLKDNDITDAIMLGTWFIDRMRANPIPCYAECTF